MAEIIRERARRILDRIPSERLSDEGKYNLVAYAVWANKVRTRIAMEAEAKARKENKLHD